MFVLATRYSIDSIALLETFQVCHSQTHTLNLRPRPLGARNSIFPELCPAYAQSGSLNSGSVNAKGKSKLNHSLHEYERKVKVQPKVLQNKGQVKGQAEVLKFFLCKLSPTFFLPF